MTNDRQESASPARDDVRTEQLACDLYERVRELNHATSGPPDLTQPGTVYTVLGNLGAAAYGLDQTLQQLNDFLLHEEGAGRLGHDREEPTAPALQECGRALGVARTHTNGLHAALGEAQSAINAIHGTSAPVHEPGPTNSVETAARDFPVPIDSASLQFPSTERSRSPANRSSRPARKEA